MLLGMTYTIKFCQNSLTVPFHIHTLNYMFQIVYISCIHITFITIYHVGPTHVIFIFRCMPMSIFEEKRLLKSLNLAIEQSGDSVSPDLKRLRRKLLVRQVRSSY